MLIKVKIYMLTSCFFIRAMNQKIIYYEVMSGGKVLWQSHHSSSPIL